MKISSHVSTSSQLDSRAAQALERPVRSAETAKTDKPAGHGPAVKVELSDAAKQAGKAAEAPAHMVRAQMTADPSLAGKPFGQLVSMLARGLRPAVPEPVPTEPPVAETPTTQTPVPPVTETPVTETPVAEVPVTETPVTEAPVAEVPVGEIPVVGTPVIDETVAEILPAAPVTAPVEPDPTALSDETETVAVA